MKNSNQRPLATRYTAVAVILHWSIAALIFFNLAVGFFMEGFPPPWKGLVVSLHISAGITVLALTIVRVAWRLTHTPPAHADGLSSWEAHLAHGVHFLLYGAMVLMPLIGWGIISAHPPVGSPGARAVAAAKVAAGPALPGRPVPARLGGPVIWGLVPLPSIRLIRAIGRTPGGVAPQQVLHDDLVDWHAIGGYLMILLLVGHVAGALKHQFVDRQPELQRMALPRGAAIRP